MQTLDDGYFANDDVTDWLLQLECASDVAILEDAFTQVVQEKRDLEPGEYSPAIAAAWVVMALLGQTVEYLPGEVRLFVKRIGKSPQPGLLVSALKAIERINAESSRHELSGGHTRSAAWSQTVADLEARLKQLVQQS